MAQLFAQVGKEGVLVFIFRDEVAEVALMHDGKEKGAIAWGKGSGIQAFGE